MNPEPRREWRVDCVDAAPCEVVRRAETLLNDFHEECLRAYASRLVLADEPCESIAEQLSLLRVVLLADRLQQIARLCDLLDELRPHARDVDVQRLAAAVAQR